MAYTPQVNLSPSFSTYMQGRTNPYAYGGGQMPGSAAGSNFGFPSYGNMWGNMMQSGQQFGVQPGVFGMPQRFSPQQQQPQQAPQQPQQPQPLAQQVAYGSPQQQQTIDFNDQGTKQSFLDEYKKLYMDQLMSKDPTYRNLANTAGSLGGQATNQVNAFNAANAGRKAGAQPDPTMLAQIQALQGKQGAADEARDKYFNNLWGQQKGMLDTLFSGQITPQMLLQGMTRGLLR